MVGRASSVVPLGGCGQLSAGTGQGIAPFAVGLFAGLLGSFCLAVVVATRGAIERFVDPEVLPARVRSGDADAALRIQQRAIGIWFLLSTPLCAAFVIE